MMATSAVRDLLIVQLSGMKNEYDEALFASVLSCPAALTLSPKFVDEVFKVLPKLVLPSCLVILKTAGDRGARPERKTDWSLVLLAKSATGDAEDANLERADAVRELCKQQIEPGKVFIEPDNDMAIGTLADPKWSVIEVAITTREYTK